MKRRSIIVATVLTAVALAADASTALAQENGDRVNPGAQGVQLEGSGLITTLVGGAFPFAETGLGGTLAVRHRWPSGLSVGVMGLHAQPEDLDLPSGDPRRTMSQWGAFGELRYHLTQLTTVRPYLGGRLGWTRLDDEADPEVAADGLGWGLTAGAEVWANDHVAFRAAGTAGGFDVSGFFDPEGSTTATSWSLEAGVAVFLGDVRRDSDGDGVPDDRDRCEGTSPRVQVDDVGCPQDSDGDGVADSLDACAGTPARARVDERGCPTDSDGDGVFDGFDACPDTDEGVPVDGGGCPRDQDDDGVHDGIDVCPNTARGAEVDARGCIPDSDGDGIADRNDECPETQYVDEVDERGCSRVQRSLQEEGRFSLPGLPFRLDALQLRGPSREIVHDVGRELADRPDAVLEIRVFTAREGRPGYNQRISQTLAEAIRSYLLGTYPSVGASRVRAVGYGERPPPDDAGDGGRRPRVDFIFLEPGAGGGGGGGGRRP